MSAVEQPPTILDQVIAAVKGGDIAKARELGQAALAEGIEHPLLLNLRALANEEAGRFEDALADLRRAHVLAPRDFTTLNACGLCLGRLERHEEALQCFDQALAIRPDFAPGWFNRGWTLERLGEMAKAESAYDQAVTLDPSHAPAWTNLAFLAVRRGDTTAAQTRADKALALQPDYRPARIARANAAMDRPQEAESELRSILAEDLTPYEGALAMGLLADALDAQDRIDEAFDAYVESNARFRAEAAGRFERPGHATIPQTLEWLNRWAQDFVPAPWIAQPARARSLGGETGHIFLMGFPRSGTTLIETALANHPDVVSLEERNTLYAAVLDFLTDESALNRLGTASEAALNRYRDDYWTRVRQFGVEPAGKVFIDKNPFAVPRLPLIQKLFPNARVIFAIRDPRDVVLSCFRRRFSLNPSTYEFLDLRRAAANYDQTMRLAETLRTKLSLPQHRLVYEQLIEDFPAVARATCEFIGVDWRERLMDIAGRARRGEVASASSAQIARGLFSDASGQWRRYRHRLTDILPVLAPWAEHFGYPVD